MPAPGGPCTGESRGGCRRLSLPVAAEERGGGASAAGVGVGLGSGLLGGLTASVPALQVGSSGVFELKLIAKCEDVFLSSKGVCLVAGYLG